MADDPQPPEPFNPFGPGGFDLSQLMRMLQSEGPVNWEVARQFAAWVAATPEGAAPGGFPGPGAAAAEPPVEPEDRSRYEELARAAQTHVVAATGLSEALSLPLSVVTRTEWAAHHLDALRPVLEVLATTLNRPGAEDVEQPEAANDPFGGLMQMLAPVLLGVQAGSMVGSLAQRALGRYDLPLPATDRPGIMVVARNVTDFGDAWSLDGDDLRFTVVLHEVVHGAIRSVQWVRDRLVALATAYVSAYEIDPSALEDSVGGFDPSDPSSLAEIQADPDALLGAIASPRQEPLRERLQSFALVLDGYADVVLEHVGAPLIASFHQVHEATRRHRLDRGNAGALVERMLGLELRREHYERGEAFARGIVERAGIDGLNRLWERPEMLPTPAELDAPGLWLARIELDLE